MLFHDDWVQRAMSSESSYVEKYGKCTYALDILLELQGRSRLSIQKRKTQMGTYQTSKTPMKEPLNNHDYSRLVVNPQEK